MTTLLITVKASDPHFWYRLFYFLPLLLLLFSLLYYGLRRNFHPLTWVISVTSFIAAFIIGTRLFVLDGSDLLQLMNGNLPFRNARSVLGGTVLGVIVILLNKKYLKVGTGFTLMLAFIAPLLKALQRFGCFIEGCCYGTHCELPWAVQHIIPGNPERFTLPAHPVQLYEAIGLIITTLLLIPISKRFKNRTNVFYMSLLFSIVVRFICEFFREGESAVWMNEIVGGLKCIQWILITFMALLTFIIRYREANAAHDIFEMEVLNKADTSKLILWVCGMTVSVVLLKNIMHDFESIMLTILLVIISAVLFFRELVNLKHSSLSRLTLVMSLACLVSMSQTMNLHPKMLSRPDVKKPESYFKLGYSYQQGSLDYDELTFGGSSSGGCGTTGSAYYNHHPYRVKNYSNRLFGQYTWFQDNKSMMTIGAVTGNNNIMVKEIDSNNTYEKSSIHFGSWFNFDSRRVGLGFGLYTGIWNHNSQKANSFVTNAYSVAEAPYIYVRYGNPLKLYAAFIMNDPVDAFFNNSSTRGELGSQFNSDKFKVTLHAGTNGVGVGTSYLMKGNYGFHIDFYMPNSYMGNQFENRTSSNRFNLTAYKLIY